MEDVNTMEAVRNMEDVDTTVINLIIAVEEYALHKTTVSSAEAVVVEPIVILQINVGNM